VTENKTNYFFEPGDLVRYVGRGASPEWIGKYGRVEAPHRRDTVVATDTWSVYWFHFRSVYWAFSDELEPATEEDVALSVLAELGTGSTITYQRSISYP
jgi:hypothetical protein